MFRSSCVWTSRDYARHSTGFELAACANRYSHLAFNRLPRCLAIVPTRPTTPRVPKPARPAMRKRTDLQKLPSSKVLGRALRVRVVTPDQSKAKTGYDVIKHLIGSCKGGSRDLATNPKHLQDFGR